MSRTTRVDQSVVEVENLATLLKTVDRQIKSVYDRVSLRCEVNQVKEYNWFVYLTLKDSSGTIRGVVPKRNYRSTLTDGDEIELVGEVKLYRSELQISLISYSVTGVGGVHAAFLKIKKKLEKKGYFDLARKREVKNDYRTIGLITSLKAAGFKDMIDTFDRRMIGGRLLVYPCLVQGQKAPLEIAEAIRLANEHQAVELLVVARGGGSKEDLECFNDPMVAREIFRSKIPVATGVGHQIDTSIADLVADRAFITPTAAAAGVTAGKPAVLNRIEQLTRLLDRQLKSGLGRIGDRLTAQQTQLSSRLSDLFADRVRKLRAVEAALHRAVEVSVRRIHAGFEEECHRFREVSPKHALERQRWETAQLYSRLETDFEQRTDRLREKCAEYGERFGELKSSAEHRVQLRGPDGLVISLDRLDFSAPHTLEFPDGRVRVRLERI